MPVISYSNHWVSLPVEKYCMGDSSMYTLKHLFNAEYNYSGKINEANSDKTYLLISNAPNSIP